MFYFLLEQATCLTLTPAEPSDMFLSTTAEDSPSSESSAVTPSRSSSHSSGMTVNLNAWPENFDARWYQNRHCTGETSIC